MKTLIILSYLKAEKKNLWKTVSAWLKMFIPKEKQL